MPISSRSFVFVLFVFAFILPCVLWAAWICGLESSQPLLLQTFLLPIFSFFFYWYSNYDAYVISYEIVPGFLFCSFFPHFFLSLHFSWGVFIDLSSCFCWFFPWPCSVYWWARHGHSSFLLQRFIFLAFSDCVLLLIKIVYIWSVQHDELIHVYTVKWSL